jgi:hypothetical protein
LPFGQTRPDHNFEWIDLLTLKYSKYLLFLIMIFGAKQFLAAGIWSAAWQGTIAYDWLANIMNETRLIKSDRAAWGLILV